jgi:hypothetical protein
VGQDILADIGGEFRILLYDLTARSPCTFETAELFYVFLVSGSVSTLAEQRK